MFGVSNRADAYSRVGVETGVAGATPHQLVVMLFDGVLLALSKARAALESENIAMRGESISKAIEIIDNGLKASLDMDAGGGELPGRLAALYDYMVDRLLYANLNANAAAIAEVSGLLASLREAWLAIEPGRQATADATTGQAGV